MEKEISAIDAIYQILEKIDSLDKKVQIIDDNIKILNNKVAKLNKNVATDQQRSMPTASTTTQPFQNQITDSLDTAVTKEPEKFLVGPIRVYGYIMNKMRQPVQEVIINIFDDNNKLVKSNKSNSDGYWESRLPSGKFNIEYIHSKFKPINKEIEIPKNVKEYEVK